MVEGVRISFASKSFHMGNMSHFRDADLAKLTLGVGLLELDVWWNDFIFECQHAFYEAIQARSSLSMADIGLYGTNVDPGSPEDFTHSVGFDRISC